MAGTMRAAVLTKVGEVEMRDVPRPEPKANEVIVKIRSVGVCGSDVHFYEWGKVGDFVVTVPMMLGHECAGDIVEVGAGVDPIRMGERVAVEPGWPCRTCEWCKAGRYNLCPNVEFLAVPGSPGAFAEYLAVPQDFAFRLPDNMSYDEGAMIEPLSVGLHSAKRGNVSAGQSVAVLGSGPIGLLTLQACKALGATTIIAVDLSPLRLDLAKTLGATHTINAGTTDVVAAVRELTGGKGVDVALETAGYAGTVKLTLPVVKRGGTVVFTGVPSDVEIPYDIVGVGMKEVDIKGIFRYANTYPAGIQLVSSGAVDVRALVTHSFPLERTHEALEFSRTRKDISIKTVVRPE